MDEYNLRAELHAHSNDDIKALCVDSLPELTIVSACNNNSTTHALASDNTVQLYMDSSTVANDDVIAQIHSLTNVVVLNSADGQSTVNNVIEHGAALTFQCKCNESQEKGMRSVFVNQLYAELKVATKMINAGDKRFKQKKKKRVGDEIEIPTLAEFNDQIDSRVKELGLDDEFVDRGLQCFMKNVVSPAEETLINDVERENDGDEMKRKKQDGNKCYKVGDNLAQSLAIVNEKVEEIEQSIHTGDLNAQIKYLERVNKIYEDELADAKRKIQQVKKEIGTERKRNKEKEKTAKITEQKSASALAEANREIKSLTCQKKEMQTRLNNLQSEIESTKGFEEHIKRIEDLNSIQNDQLSTANSNQRTANEMIHQLKEQLDNERKKVKQRKAEKLINIHKETPASNKPIVESVFPAPVPQTLPQLINNAIAIANLPFHQSSFKFVLDIVQTMEAKTEISRDSLIKHAIGIYIKRITLTQTP